MKNNIGFNGGESADEIFNSLKSLKNNEEKLTLLTDYIDNCASVFSVRTIVLTQYIFRIEENSEKTTKKRYKMAHYFSKRDNDNFNTSFFSECWVPLLSTINKKDKIFWNLLVKTFKKENSGCAPIIVFLILLGHLIFET